MQAYIAEFVGVALLILMGDGVVANVVLARTKGNGGGGGGAWITINFGWAVGVFIAVMCVAAYSGAHLNPAVTIALAYADSHAFSWDKVAGYITGQMLGAIVGGVLMYLFYRPHFDDTTDADLKLGTFCCAPQYRHMGWAMFCETIGTFVLVFAVMAIGAHKGHIGPEGTAANDLILGPLDALPVALVVLGIGLSLGGTTGYAINPARDLGPRIAHAILPIPGKRDSDWGYAMIPVIGPIIGGVLAAMAYPLLAAVK